MSYHNRSPIKHWAEWLLFFSSYSPLYVIIAVKTRVVSYDFILFKTPVYSIEGYSVSLISLALLGGSLVVLAFLAMVVYFTRSENGQPRSVQEPTKRNEVFISYILAHVIPFAFIDYTSTLNFFAFVMLFLAIGVVQVRSNYLYINPVLSLCGFDMYEITDTEGRGQMLLAKMHEDPGSKEFTLTAAELSNNVYITTR